MPLYAWAVVATLMFSSAAGYAEETPKSIVDAVEDVSRPAEQRALDAFRRPAQVIAFAGVGPGDRVAEFMPGNAYFTRILSRIVGPLGRVNAFTPEEQIKNCDPSEVAGSRAIEHDPQYANVVPLLASVNAFSVPEKVDVLWTAQNYHDLHDAFLRPADMKKVNVAFFQALKPGGILLIIDHVAAVGSGLRDTERLHRIDPVSVRHEVESAGFVFEGELTVLRNREDDHTLSVFDAAIRGRTDQFVFKFRKPKAERTRNGIEGSSR